MGFLFPLFRQQQPPPPLATPAFEEAKFGGAPVTIVPDIPVLRSGLKATDVAGFMFTTLAFGEFLSLEISQTPPAATIVKSVVGPISCLSILEES